jgi:hypothetical protein
MDASVLVLFDSRADAYGFLSESRRLATSLLWEVTIEPADEGWLMRLPPALFATSMADALDRFHGRVLEPDEGSKSQLARRTARSPMTRRPERA